jgi:hypothetical protein
MYSLKTEILGPLPDFQYHNKKYTPRSPKISPRAKTKDTPAFSDVRVRNALSLSKAKKFQILSLALKHREVYSYYPNPKESLLSAFEK